MLYHQQHLVYEACRSIVRTHLDNLQFSLERVQLPRREAKSSVEMTDSRL